MQAIWLKSRLHGVRVTDTDPEGEDAFALDGDLLELAAIHEYEQIQVHNLTTGERLTSYAVRAEYGSRAVIVNGPATYKVSAGDRLSIHTYIGLNHQERTGFTPILIYCDARNHVTEAINRVFMEHYSPVQPL